MHVVQTYVEYHFANGSVEEHLVDDRNIAKLVIPKGVEKLRFYDVRVIAPVGIAAAMGGAVYTKPENYSEYYVV